MQGWLSISTTSRVSLLQRNNHEMLSKFPTRDCLDGLVSQADYVPVYDNREKQTKYILKSMPQDDVKENRARLVPVGSVGDETHQTTRDETSGGHSDEPTHVNPGNHAPVDSAPVTVAETDADDSTGDTLSGGDGKF